MTNKFRPKLSAFIALSIDGYIARENGNLDWLDKIAALAHAAGEDGGYPEFYAQIDALIMGRKTYEKVLSFEKWPYADKRVIVLSNSLKNLDNLNESNSSVELFSGDLLKLLERLNSQNVKNIYVDGGETICNFLDLGILDEMILTIIPVVLGTGIRLFSNNQHEHWYELKNIKQYSNNLVQLHYLLK